MDDLEIPRADALPENAAYSDDGCPDGTFPSCLTCPLPRCRYDDPGGLSAIRRATRNASIAGHHKRGVSVAEIAETFGLSRRTVFRVLARGGR